MWERLTDISTHTDMGFGVTADNFRESAEFLHENYGNHIYNAAMPTFYLYRHSIELYLKFLITIYHRTFKIDYSKGQSSKHNIPLIKDRRGNPLDITKCHDILTLYENFVNLVKENILLLERKAPDGNWNIINDENLKYVELIRNYDIDSTYFRYPFTKNQNVDSRKFDVKKINIEASNLNPSAGESAMVFLNNEGKVVEAHGSNQLNLNRIEEALIKLSDYFHRIHSMTRITLNRENKI
ncbi:hypothetical protein U6X16_15340 [Bacillus velezensis]|uniref:hypothetical protein n=1 Tax=Bacillus velezensis TaxID=492670 RepID=UPI002ADDC077|nr:hypothetical protein [Bacillus velezensis]MEA1007062.1 hypothetical protein [Bacillus velezensis]